MSKRLYSHKRVRYWYAYDIDDICTVFSDLGLHPQTVRAWVKNGLKIIDSGKPTLIYGNDLISFLKKKNSQNKCSTEFDQLYCMKCQDARPVFRNMVIVEHKNKFLKVQGHCRACKTSMFKSYKMETFPELRKTFTLVDVLELYDPTLTTDKAHIETQEVTTLNESDQGSLF